MQTPAIVNLARQRANEGGFTLSCELAVGRLLATLAAAAPPNGRLCELGTGTGVGLAWLIHGVGDRTDIELVTVDNDADLLRSTAAAAWPGYVQFVHGDGAEEVARRAPFDLIFADAYGGKLHGLEATIAALRPGGVLVVDDMDPALHEHDGLAAPLAAVRQTLVSHTRLVAAELDFSSGVILCTKV